MWILTYIITKLDINIKVIIRGLTSDEATRDVIENQIPDIVRRNKSGELAVENIVVFCEKGVFDVGQTKLILKAGKDQGNFRINFHGEELNYLGSAEVCRISLRISFHLIHLIK